MKLLKSFAFKNAVFYFFIFLLGLGTIGFLMLNNSSNRIIKTAKDQLIHNGDLVEVQLEDYIEGLLSQLDYLASSPVLREYLNKLDTGSYNLLLNNYLSVIRSNNDFSQLRFIEAENGKEVIRVNQVDGIADITEPSQLQFKADRPYFKETIKLDSGEVYFSEINLNKEFGKISIPRTPTLRIACPLYYSFQLKGIVVINTDLTKLFNRLKNTVGTDFTLRMLNEKGYYLMHEEADSTFTFEYTSNMPPSYLSTSNFMKDGIVSLPEELMSVQKVRINHMDYDFIFQVIANRSLLMKPYYEWRSKSLLLIFLTGLVFTLIAFYILKRQSETFKGLTRSMKQFSTERKLEQLAIQRDDEIGELARSFQEMSTLINEQINSIQIEKQNAEQAERDKSEFIENISHEVRNPLQSILGLSKMLEQNSPNPNQIDILNSIKLNTSNLVGLVNDILDYQNVINGNYKSDLLWVSIDSLILELVTGNQYAASQKGIQIENKIDDNSIFLEFKLDKLRLSQILNNLISNGITHTAVNGKINIETKIIEQKNGIAKVAFSVVDDGIGMSKDELLKIEDRYFSNKESQSKELNFGLGLTIVNELLNLFDSELKVSSEKNIGSTFYFEIDLEYRSKETEVVNDSKYERLSKDLKVLVLDDDNQILDYYKYFFIDMEAIYLSSFSQLKNDLSTTFDLIISDYRFGESTILEYLKELKSVASKQCALIIASGTEPDIKTIRKEFPNALSIKKPFNKDQLNKQINIGVVLSRYGLPNLENIKADYDFNQNKYAKALKLLINEWEEYGERLDQCMKRKSASELDEILHKFNTTLRRLKLPKIESRLTKVLADLSAPNKRLEIERKEIANIMISYLSFLQQSS